MPVPQGTTLELGPNGEPIGVFWGAPLVVALKAKLPPPPLEQRVQGLRAIMRDYNAQHGGAHRRRDDGPGLRPAFELWRRKQMTVRVGLNIEVADAEGARRRVQVLPGRFGDDWLKILGLGEVVL